MFTEERKRGKEFRTEGPTCEGTGVKHRQAREQEVSGAMGVPQKTAKILGYQWA